METGIGEVSKTERKSAPSISAISFSPLALVMSSALRTNLIESISFLKTAASSSETSCFIITETWRFSLKNSDTLRVLTRSIAATPTSSSTRLMLTTDDR